MLEQVRQGEREYEELTKPSIAGVISSRKGIKAKTIPKISRISAVSSSFFSSSACCLADCIDWTAWTMRNTGMEMTWSRSSVGPVHWPIIRSIWRARMVVCRLPMDGSAAVTTSLGLDTVTSPDTCG